jgi:CRP-like cAMP-binding protein
MTRDGRTGRINRMKAGDYFGELGLLCDGIRTATVTADTDCAVLRITGTDFGEALATAGGLSRRMSATMTARLARSRQ